MTEVKLSWIEMMLAHNIAAARYMTARKNLVKNCKMGSQSDSYTDLIGICGEMAVAKHYNVYPDLTVSPRSCGYDLIIEGKRIDVKTTPYESGRLLHTLKETSDVDCYVLVTGENDTFRIRGYARHDELCVPENITDLGHGNGYSMDQSKLTDMALL